MDYAPPVSWDLARRVARRAAGQLPDIDPRELDMLTADLRVTARRAGELAAAHLGLESVGATSVRVVDWAGWSRAARHMAEAVVGELSLTPRPAGVGSALRGLGNGLLAGLAMGRVSRQLLGQYDAVTGDDALYLVAPTILQHERRHAFVPEHFRLWVALHEQTHALQFRAAPWLRDYVRERMAVVADDEVQIAEALIAWQETGDLVSLLVSREAHTQLHELTALMTLLEGHADLVSDTVGCRHATTVGKMRKAFARPQRTGRLANASATLDKQAQYRDGLAFCRTVVRRRSWKFLSRAFADPGNLPTMSEISDPQAWIDRQRRG
ncbi:putative hydrolase/uncharacterized protein, coenzyme F420 biosynthesis associated [Tessaracoccus flavus]|nr:putative hydrolase/uncharacterized protein, coenzyme F420 biosynthesis associated [Tessaracoccus flavus]